MMNLFIRIGSVVEPEYREKKCKNLVCSGLILLALCIRHFKRIVDSFTGKYVVVPRLEIAITSRCSLKCKNCVSLMQFYDKPYDVDTELNILSLRKIFDSVDQVNQLKILGGEPFMHKDLYKIIDVASKYDSVKKIMIVTNGTIIPKGEDLLRSLSNDKVVIRISYYGEMISRNAEAIKEICKDNNINCSSKFEKEMWQYPGQPYRRNKSIKKLKRQYSKCDASLCNNLLGGKLHHCSRSSNGMNMGVIPDEPKDYFDVMQDISRSEFRKEILKFIYNDIGYIIACDYCNLATDEAYDVPPGEQ